MKAFTFQAPANILFEAGASRKLAELVSEYGAKRVLLVTDRGVRNAGLTANAEAALVSGGYGLTVFDDVKADPPSHVIERAVALCRDKGIELVASIGGGSALDTAKLVAYLAKTPDRLDDIYGVGLAKGEPSTPAAGADNGRHRFRGDANRYRHYTHNRKEGCRRAAIVAGLGHSRSGVDTWLACARNGGDRYRRDGARDRSLYK
jgi:hypothetical protein